MNHLVQLFLAKLQGARVDSDEILACHRGLLTGVDTETNPSPDPLTPLEQLLGRAEVSRDFRDAGKGAEFDRVKAWPTKIYGWPARKDRGQSRGAREWSSIDRVVIHTAGVRGMGPDRWLGVPCHAAVADDATIVLCHRNDAYLWAAHALNRRSVSIEIAGNRTIDDDQIEPARELLRYVVADLRAHRAPGDERPIYLDPHRHGHKSRGNDCDGPIWMAVGEWALDELGLVVGEPVGSGRSTPADWWSPGRAPE